MILIVSASELDLLFLKNANSSMTLSFFCCNVRNSRTLIWEINGEGIGHFNGLTDVIADHRSSYTYFASLLSKRNDSRQLSFDSVLLIRAPNGSIVNVTCVNQRGKHEIISNQADPMNTENNEIIRNTLVNMRPLFLRNSTIVSDGRNISTRAFLCDSINARDLSWEADISNMTENFEFNSISDIGTSYSRRTDDMNTLGIQAISLGQLGEKFYSILYVTDISFMGVRCLAGGKVVGYSVRDPETITSDEGKQMKVGGSGRERNREGLLNHVCILEVYIFANLILPCMSSCCKISIVSLV